MKNFKLIKDNVDARPFLDEFYNLQKEKIISEDFGVSITDTIARKKYGEKYIYAPHKSGWVSILSPFLIRNFEKETKDSPLLLKTLPYRYSKYTLSFLKKFAEENNSYLQRAAFTTLLPGGDVSPHTDSGEYFKHRDRFHLVLQSELGSEFTCGGEKQIFNEGELWWFANKEIHSVKNSNTKNRIHIIFDLLPKNHYKLYQKVTLFILNCFLQKIYKYFGYEGFNNLLDKNIKLKSIVLGKIF